jgi:hypothetical protein
MHNIKTNFDKIFNICKHHLDEFCDAGNNFESYRHPPKMSDLQIVALSITAESLGIDSENLLFYKLKKEYFSDFPNLVDRTNYNRRRKKLAYYISLISQSIANTIESDKRTYIIDSLPLPICKNIRIPRNKICLEDEHVKPSRSYHACHKTYYFGFKLQLIINQSGIPYCAALTTASMHDSQYLKCLDDIQLTDCELIADGGYLSKVHQLQLFESYNIQLITPKRTNMKQLNTDWTPKKRYQRKRIETLYSQLDDQMMIKRNYAKSLNGLLTRVCTKVSAAAVLQMLNFENKKPLNNIKHALAA